MNSVVLSHPLASIHHGDCLDVLAEMPNDSVDAIVTDPPYGLGFMGKAWDDLPPGLLWAQECLRVLKPGGHLLAFGGTRTWHRLAVAVEDAGFEMRDSIAWLYGSGFPKSRDVSKAIDKAAGATREVTGKRNRDLNWRGVEDPDSDRYADTRANRPAGSEQGHITERARMVPITAPATPAAKQWQGWGTALKPAFEPIVVGRKPLVGTVAANVLTHGVGALNIDATRVQMCDADREIVDKCSGGEDQKRNVIYSDGAGGRPPGERFTSAPAGRWPTNVTLDDATAAELDEQSGNRPGRASQNDYSTKPKFEGGVNLSGSMARQTGYVEGYNDSGGASRFFPVFKYQAKAPTRERPSYVNESGKKVSHPTVKPKALMAWLCRLVTPPAGTVLDPFAGSGATVEAAIEQGFYAIGIERELEYIPLIGIRLDRVDQLAS